MTYINELSVLYVRHSPHSSFDLIDLIGLLKEYLTGTDERELDTLAEEFRRRARAHNDPELTNLQMNRYIKNVILTEVLSPVLRDINLKAWPLHTRYVFMQRMRLLIHSTSLAPNEIDGSSFQTVGRLLPIFTTILNEINYLDAKITYAADSYFLNTDTLTELS